MTLTISRRRPDLIDTVFDTSTFHASRMGRISGSILSVESMARLAGNR
jgi:hypothetical protein